MKRHGVSNFALAIVLSAASVILTCGVSNAGKLPVTSSALRQTSDIDISPAKFRALDNLAIGEKAGVIPMTDDQLASIEGGRRDIIVNVGINVAVPIQINIAILSRGGSQGNSVVIGQVNSFQRRR